MRSMSAAHSCSRMSTGSVRASGAAANDSSPAETTCFSLSTDSFKADCGENPKSKEAPDNIHLTRPREKLTGMDSSVRIKENVFLLYPVHPVRIRFQALNSMA